MSTNSAADLLAELFADLGPAKVANPAKTEHPCGLPADSRVCEDLRNAANSQAIAEIRKPANRPESECRRGLSQDSQLSQGVDAQMRFVAWSGADVDRFVHYRGIAARARFTPEMAEEIAERLVIRDRDRDDRSMCLECAELTSRGRCLAAHRGALHGADSQLQPVRTVLQRCEGFEPKPLLEQEIYRTKNDE